MDKLMQRYGLTLPPRPPPRLADPELSTALAFKYQRGASLEALGSEYRHSAGWVLARLVEAGVRVRAVGEQLRLAHPDQIRTLLDERLRTSEIAERLGCSTTSVLEVMRRHGWKAPPPRPRGSSKALPPLPSGKQLRTWYVDQGLPVREITEKTGIPSHRIQTALAAHGISRRRSGWVDG